ncbi:lasso RiPP family leader peptide-containing protein [Spirosoma sp. KNUC1025]|nr:lasso RiPP family leader peptide-containing protein [Spirosoma sp. KNUC1025]
MNQATSGKKTYKKPQLKKLGSVKALTLKLGSNTDMQSGHF